MFTAKSNFSILMKASGNYLSIPSENVKIINEEEDKFITFQEQSLNEKSKERVEEE